MHGYLIKYLFIYWDNWMLSIFSFFDVVYHMNWFVHVEPSLWRLCDPWFFSNMLLSLHIFFFLVSVSVVDFIVVIKDFWMYSSSVQFSRSVCPTLCNPMNCSMPGLPVHHQLPEFTQTHIHRVGDAIQPSHPLSSPSPPAPNHSQHQSLFQWVNSLHEVAKVVEFQL